MDGKEVQCRLPLVWRSSRQPLVTLSTAESELIEAVEGALLGLSTQSPVEELSGQKPVLEIRVDNQSALALTTGSTGSWRTRHLRLRTNWLKERVMKGEIKMCFEPGTTQRADLGTKALPKDRLQHLVEGMVGWIGKLALLCQVCGTKAMRPEEALGEVDNHSDFYVIVLVIAMAAVVLWEIAKKCGTSRLARLQLLRADDREPASEGALSRRELAELQQLLEMDPGDLSLDEAERLMALRVRFGAGRATTQRRSTPQSQLRHVPPEPVQPPHVRHDQFPAASSSQTEDSPAVMVSEAGTQTEPPLLP